MTVDRRHDGVPLELELTTDRGPTMRCWRSADGPALRVAFDDPTMVTQIEAPLDDDAAAIAWIDARRTAWAAGRAYSWVVVDGPALLGSVTVSAIDRRHDTGWVSYWTATAARGRGVASSSLRAMADWAFDELGLFRLELGHRTNNPASCRVALAAGFVVEGLERQKLRYGDERFDVELHARLATDRPAADGAG